MIVGIIGSIDCDWILFSRLKRKRERKMWAEMMLV